MKKLKCRICKKVITSGSKSGLCKSCAFKGKNNPRFIHGKRCVDFKNHCKDCNKIISQSHIYCNSCASQGKRNGNYKHGQTNNKCIDCGKKITFQRKRCRKCWIKYVVKNKLRKGTNSNFYKDGTGYNPYTKEFTLKLREKIRIRDDDKCVICGMTKKEHYKKYNRNLEVHHIDHDKTNCKKSNLETRCKRCNVKDNFK